MTKIFLCGKKSAGKIKQRRGGKFRRAASAIRLVTVP